jgi:hypothetical protein
MNIRWLGMHMDMTATALQDLDVLCGRETISEDV